MMLDITSKEGIEIIDQPVDNNSPIKLNIEKIEIEEEFDGEWWLKEDDWSISMWSIGSDIGDDGGKEDGD